MGWFQFVTDGGWSLRLSAVLVSLEISNIGGDVDVELLRSLATGRDEKTSAWNASSRKTERGPTVHVYIGSVGAARAR